MISLSLDTVPSIILSFTERRELKGLDIVRRDWSGIAKEAGQ